MRFNILFLLEEDAIFCHQNRVANKIFNFAHLYYKMKDKYFIIQKALFFYVSKLKGVFLEKYLLMNLFYSVKD